MLVLRLDERAFSVNFFPEKDYPTRASMQETNSNTAIEAIGLTKDYNSEQRVTGVDFTLKDKEIFGILGPSGAGKSSIFKMVTFAMQRTSGHLKVLGREMQPGDL